MCEGLWGVHLRTPVSSVPSDEREVLDAARHASQLSSTLFMYAAWHSVSVSRSNKAHGTCIMSAAVVDSCKCCWKRHRFMCYYSVAARCSFQPGHSKEGICWDTSQNYIDIQ